MDYTQAIFLNHGFFLNSDYLVVNIWVSTVIQNLVTVVVTLPDMFTFEISYLG